MNLSTYFHAKVVVITGAARGLGLELARQLAPLVRGLILLDINSLKDDELDRQFGVHKNKVWMRKVDASNWQEMQALGMEHPFKTVDVVIANAGKGGVNPANAFSIEMDRSIMTINYFGTIHTFSAFLPGMLDRKEGQLVGIGSLASMRGLPNASSYCASKAAQLNLLESWRLDLMPFNIAVTTILPGFIKTPMTNHQEFEMPFMMEVEVCARQILCAIAKRKKQYMLPWPMRFLSLFNRIMPVFLFDFILPLVSGRKVKSQAKMF